MHFWSKPPIENGRDNKRFSGVVAVGGAIIGVGIIFKYSAFLKEYLSGCSYVKCIAVGAAVSCVWNFYTWSMEEKYLPTINEIKFGKYTNKPCRGHIYSKHDCTETARRKDPSFTCSYALLRWMIDILDSAQETLDFAMYLVTCQDFKDAIMRAHRRGVRIRFLTDHIMSQGTASVIPLCIAAGIPVRMNEKTKMMHRKSVLIDGRAVLMGTGNWTMQALAGNFETWVLTGDPPVVQAHTEAFEHQWNEEGVIEPTLEQFREFGRYIN